jgi:hypothetical protein
MPILMVQHWTDVPPALVGAGVPGVWMRARMKWSFDSGLTIRATW